ncbi:hypothetical protein [Sulfurovum sp. NBC37-1]|uniref:hypothetical protein n=1 Tax=Sulfurovum sp. (strain NBC37-1) TaxID=387093 RepID=UPI0001587B62|nr:hypothetical protein [Sulfurovum sp. NBC37-1]BAF72487.1 hypothetical protein SUN_1536 [Sulfurovum sp. NBC37-1]
MTLSPKNRWKFINIKSIHVGLATILFTLLNLMLRWPGKLTPDSANQLRQAISGHYSDGNPPIMAIIWRELLPITDPTVVMLVLQTTLFWLGIGLFAAVLAQKDHHRAALVMLISGFTPIALMYTGVILKDSLMTSFFIAAFGLAAWKDVRLRSVGLLLGATGMLTRLNAVFAFPSLLFLALRLKLSLFKSLIYALIISIALIPLSQWINHDIFGAERAGLERSLQIYDLAGIAYFSGDTSVLPVDITNLSECYTPYYWDTLGAARCDYTFGKLDNSITREWITGIITHPLAYMQHRLSHFNYETFFLVPPVQQCVEAPEAHDCPRSLLSDFVSKNGLLWPVAWLTLGIVMLLSGLGDIPRALTISALMYGFAYLIIGVASQFRYYYWTEIAIQTALIFQIATAGFPKWRIAALSVLAIWIMGYLWRISYLF